MFSKQSRYRGVPDAVAPDPRGRVLAAKDIRPLPEVTGTFRHTIVAGDRLDRLAATYYGQPLQYWRICDANPRFLSPLALLGQEPLGTTRFPVTVASGPPPWAAALAALSDTAGVDRVTVIEDVTLTPEQQLVNGEPVTVVVEQYRRALSVTHNRITADAPAVAAVIKAAGFAVGAPVEGGQLGQQIVVPPAVGG